MNARKVKLGDVCTVVSGSTPSSKSPEYWNGDVVWITPAELTEDSYIISDSCRHLTQLGVQSTSLKPFPAGTVILTSRAPIGKTAIAGREMYCNQGFKNLICSPCIYNRYLYFFLTARTEFLNSLGRGATFKELSKSIVENIEIYLPEINTQKFRAEILLKIKFIIQKKKLQLQKLDSLVKSRFIELFEEKFPFIKIGNVFKTTSGGTPNTSCSEYYTSGTIPWLTSGEVNQGIITSTKNYITEEGLNHSSAKWVPKNTVVIAMYGATAGQVGLLKIDSTTNQAVCSVLPNPKFSPFYLYHAIAYKKEWMIQQCTGGAQPNISQSIIKKMEIISPPLPLQKEFATFVQQVDKSKFLYQFTLKRFTDILFAQRRHLYG